MHRRAAGRLLGARGAAASIVGSSGGGGPGDAGCGHCAGRGAGEFPGAGRSTGHRAGGAASVSGTGFVGGAAARRQPVRPGAGARVAGRRPAAPTPPPPPEPVFRDITVPSGTTLSIELRTPLASDKSTVEESVQGVLRRALVVDGVEVVPAGAAVSGSVTEAVRSARVKGRARLALRFTSVTIDREPVRMATASIAHEAQGTKKKDAARIGIGAGAGAVIGAIAGGGDGAAIGATIGGAAGTGTVLATRGEEVELAAGTTLSTRLTQPLTVRVKQP